MATKEELINLISVTDKWLGEAKKYIDAHEGEETKTEEEVKFITSICTLIFQMLQKQYELRMLCLKEYGVLVTTENGI